VNNLLNINKRYNNLLKQGGALSWKQMPSCASVDRRQPACNCSAITIGKASSRTQQLGRSSATASNREIKASAPPQILTPEEHFNTMNNFYANMPPIQNQFESAKEIYQINEVDGGARNNSQFKPEENRISIEN